MKGIILLNAEKYQFEIDYKNSFVICCDGAFDLYRDAKTDLLVGDMDSISKVPAVKTELLNRDKNFSDSEHALKILLKKNIDSIEIYGGGKRDDHQYFNMQLLLLALQKNIPCVLKTNYCDIYAANGMFELKVQKGQYISVAPAGGSVHIIDSEGLKYPLKNLTLKNKHTLGLSNVCEKNNVKMVIKRGTAFIFLVRGGK